MKILSIFVLVFTVLLPVRADEVASIQMTGGMVAFGPQQSLEASFLWDITTNAMDGGMSAVTVGTISPFSFVGETITTGSFPQITFEFQNSLRDQWFLTPLNGGFTPPVDPEFGYRIDIPGAETGIADFVVCGTPGDLCNTGGYAGFYPEQGTIQTVSVSTTPEPSTTVLLLAGLTALIWLARLEKRFNSC